MVLTALSGLGPATAAATGQESVEQEATDRIEPYVAIVSKTIPDLARHVDESQKLLGSMLE